MSSSVLAVPESEPQSAIYRSTATTPSLITPGYGEPTMAPGSAGPATPARTASWSMAITSPSMASSWNTTSSFRSSGMATEAALTSINQRFPTILPTSPVSPALPAQTAGHLTNSPTLSPAMRLGGSASTASSGILTSCSLVPSKFPTTQTFASTT